MENLRLMQEQLLNSMPQLLGPLCTHPEVAVTKRDFKMSVNYTVRTTLVVSDTNVAFTEVVAEKIKKRGAPGKGVFMM